MTDDEPLVSIGPMPADTGRSLGLAIIASSLPAILALGFILVAVVVRGANPWGLLAPFPFAAIPVALALAYRVRSREQPRIVLDPVSRQVLFVHCWQASGFVPRCPAPEKLCNFEDIRAVFSFTYRGSSTTVTTDDGRVVFDQNWTDYRRVSAALRRAADGRSPLVSFDNPVAMFVLTIAGTFAIAVCAIAVIVWLTGP
ncbi:MAG: hypothetical protein U0746_00810 [Gemmataceae bacterium]